MKGFAKWVALGWSLFCLFGVFVGIINASLQAGKYTSEAQKVGATIGAGLGLISWIVIWLVIAGPALFIFLISAGPKPATAPLNPAALPDTKACPMCAEEVKIAALKCKHCGHQFDPEDVAAQLLPPSQSPTEPHLLPPLRQK